jgi:hypothetical protein
MQSTEDFRKEKAERIIEVTNHALIITLRLLNEIDKHKRKQPRIKSKRTNYRSRFLHRHKYAILLAEMAIIKYTTDFQIQIIISQPIPKFKPGGVTNNEAESTHASSTIGETGQEFINGSIVPNSHAIQSLPARQRNNI